MSNAVCHHGAISLELKDSILVAAIVVVAMMSPSSSPHVSEVGTKCRFLLGTMALYSALVIDIHERGESYLNRLK
jgi:hypothetical protein